MKLVTLTMATAFAALSLTAHAETVGEKTGVNSALGLAPTTKDFVTEAAISDMFEIQSSQLAETQTDGATKTFAQKMIKDHSETTSQLKALAEKANIAVPTQLDSSHQKMLDQLKAAKGGDFAKQYHEDQDTGHKQAVSLFERYGKSGDNAALKDWAETTLPHLQDHYAMAKDLDK